MERKRNAPEGIFGLTSGHAYYKGYEEFTYDWNVIYTGDDFTMWEYFDACEWGTRYCACYKGKAFDVGDHFGTVRDAYFAVIDFLNFKERMENNNE